jgi:EAL domain-containing protein (putative c-di-GMP-specific phosphodiesterase class I)
MLHDNHFSFGIDHFGFSVAAASLMHALRPNYVKIDRRLINDMSEHQDTRKMIGSLAEVANSLNITTIAQGVESEAQWLLLQSMQIKGAQGYLIGKPREIA